MPRKMTELDLARLLKAEIDASRGGPGDTLTKEQSENLSYYMGEKFGNEQAGRSQVVSTDVADTVDWILPQLMRIFTGSGDAVGFEPRTAADVPFAEQATALVNHVWNRQNPGFQNFYTWFKDALIAKNGFLKIWWDTTEETKPETYQGLSLDGLSLLEADPTLRLVAVTDVGEGTAASFNVKAVRTKKTSQVRVLPVPPGEFLISREATSIETARFVAHRRKRTVSSLIQEGLPRALVEACADQDPADDEDMQAWANGGDGLATLADNQAMREIWVTEAYLRVDVDGDGVAEMRQILCAGSEPKILRDRPWEGDRPFVSLTPIPMPHSFYGRSVADLVKDVQLIKSTILRQYLDGLYLANNPRQEAVEANIVDPAELLVSRPGGVVRVREPGSIRPLTSPFVGGAALDGLSYIDQIRENRTGVSPRTQGLADNPLHPTAAGQRLLMSTAQAKVELVARVFAETGVRDAFRMILRLLTRRMPKGAVLRFGADWREVSPERWDPLMDVKVRVGLGVNDDEKRLEQALALLSLQKEALPLGLVGAEHFLATADLITNAMGLGSAERFFRSVDPAKARQSAAAASQPGSANEAPSPTMLANQQNTDRVISLEERKALADLELKRIRLEEEFAFKREELAQKMAFEREKFDAEQAAAREEAQIDQRAEEAAAGSSAAR